MRNDSVGTLYANSLANISSALRQTAGVLGSTPSSCVAPSDTKFRSFSLSIEFSEVGEVSSSMVIRRVVRTFSREVRPSSCSRAD